MHPEHRILRALIASAAPQSLAGGAALALDLTSSGVAARSLAEMGIECRRTALTRDLYGLVVCTLRTLPRLIPRVQAGGSIILHVRPGQHGDLLNVADTLTLVASARTPSGAWLQLQRRGDTRAIPPRVSLVVAVRDDAAPLAHLLNGLEDQPTDPAWELVVVDRGSSDATADLLEQTHGDIHRVRVPRAISSIDALFAGLKVARGDIVFPLPIGMLPTCGFVTALARLHDAGQLPPAPLLGSVITPQGRLVPGASIRAWGRACTPWTPRRLQRWMHRTDGVQVPGFRAQQMERSGSVGGRTQRVDGSAKSQSHPVLAQSG